MSEDIFVWITSPSILNYRVGQSKTQELAISEIDKLRYGGRSAVFKVRSFPSLMEKLSEIGDRQVKVIEIEFISMLTHQYYGKTPDYIHVLYGKSDEQISIIGDPIEFYSTHCGCGCGRLLTDVPQPPIDQIFSMSTIQKMPSFMFYPSSGIVYRSLSSKLGYYYSGCFYLIIIKERGYSCIGKIDSDGNLYITSAKEMNESS